MSRVVAGLILLALAASGAPENARTRKGLTFGTGFGLGFTRGLTPGREALIPENVRTYFSLALPRVDLGYAPSERLNLCLTAKMAPYALQAMADDYRGFFQWWKRAWDWEPALRFFVAVAALFIIPTGVVVIPLARSHILGGVGATWYLRPEAPSGYLKAALGRSFPQFTFPEEAAGLSCEGAVPGLYGGLGYEFRPHLGLELGAMWGAARLTGGQPHHDVLTVSLALEVALY